MSDDHPDSLLAQCAPTSSDVACAYSVDCSNVLDAQKNSFTLSATFGTQPSPGVFTGELDLLYTSAAGAIENCKYDGTVR